MSGGNQTRVVLLRLYARILRLHREKLPLPLRVLGDQYVREEFRNMWKLKEADLGKHHKEFSKQWEDYTRSLSLTASQDPEGKSFVQDPETTRAMDSLGQRVSELNEEQKDQLRRLKTEIEDLTK